MSVHLGWQCDNVRASYDEIPTRTAEVELFNPVADTVTNANYRGVDVEWYIKADDIVLKNKGRFQTICRSAFGTGKKKRI